MRESLQQYCNENNRPDLLRQWDNEANLPLTPETITSGSSQKIWWVCEKGHRWQAATWERTLHCSGCPVCSGKKIVPGLNDLKTADPELADEWDGEKNGSLQPDEFSPNSHQKVWWKCRICGHEWQAQIKARAGAARSGCPVCANKIVVPGRNDLASACPEVAAEWHQDRNGTLTPQKVSAGSTRKVWWKCRTCGYEWQAAVFSRTGGSGCPVCAGKKIVPGVNDLASHYPELAAQWHPTKNHKVLPSEVLPHSTRKIWWVCDKGHEWQAQITARVNGSGCPICANRQVLTGYNDFAAAYPELAKQWVREKNLPITPEKITSQSNLRVWWRCENGHEWQAKVSARVTHGSGCPYCSGRQVLAGFNDLATVYPKLAAQWNTERNGSLTPEMVTPGSSKKVWWKCGAGHEWQALVYSRTSSNKNGCPYCSGRYREVRKYGNDDIVELKIIGL